jgi:hypothetical protein
MVQTPQTNRIGRWVAFGVLASFLLASLAPLAAAERDERPRRERDDRPDHPDRPARELKAFKISLSGTATTKDNETYRISLEGEGRARAHSRDGNLTDVKGIARLKAQLLDENGTVVKEGMLKVRFHAHKTAEGEWRWHLVAVGKSPRGFPNLVLRGTGGPSESGVIDLAGHGKAVVKLPDANHRTVLRLDVAGTVSRA